MYDKDLLILHDDVDDLVDVSYSEKAIQVYSPADLKIIPGMDMVLMELMVNRQSSISMII
ncbi:hypothetical protein CNEO2_180067 [Clostridium neonatale]|uniref:hypothetical protein n=1 Tax=Clostridium neonatale TaxID=137838 RepID=UPI00291BBF3A|nr:hypothetical protein [Clostridium neonatale]CAI3599758.1 hypothetical protein CNEO2_180067 [Clostridium neonatale]